MARKAAKVKSTGAAPAAAPAKKYTGPVYEVNAVKAMERWNEQSATKAYAELNTTLTSLQQQAAVAKELPTFYESAEQIAAAVRQLQSSRRIPDLAGTGPAVPWATFVTAAQATTDLALLTTDVGRSDNPIPPVSAGIRLAAEAQARRTALEAVLPPKVQVSINNLKEKLVEFIWKNSADVANKLKLPQPAATSGADKALSSGAEVTLTAMLSFLTEAVDVSPALCLQPVKAISEFLSSFQPQALSGKDTAVFDSMEQLLVRCAKCPIAALADLGLGALATLAVARGQLSTWLRLCELCESLIDAGVDRITWPSLLTSLINGARARVTSGDAVPSTAIGLNAKNVPWNYDTGVCIGAAATPTHVFVVTRSDSGMAIVKMNATAVVAENVTLARTFAPLMPELPSDMQMAVVHTPNAPLLVLRCYGMAPGQFVALNADTLEVVDTAVQLEATGRSLVGAAPAALCSVSEHYFGVLDADETSPSTTARYRVFEVQDSKSDGLCVKLVSTAALDWPVSKRDASVCAAGPVCWADGNSSICQSTVPGTDDWFLPTLMASHKNGVVAWNVGDGAAYMFGKAKDSGVATWNPLITPSATVARVASHPSNDAVVVLDGEGGLWARGVGANGAFAAPQGEDLVSLDVPDSATVTAVGLGPKYAVCVAGDAYKTFGKAGFADPSWPAPGTEDPITDIAVTDTSAVLLTKAGKVKVVDFESGGLFNTTTPVDVTLPEAISAVYAGDEHVVLIAASGALFTLGANSKQQRGTATAVDVKTPHQVILPSEPKQVAVGSHMTLFLGADGHAYGFGNGAAAVEQVSGLSGATIKALALAGTTPVAVCGIDWRCLRGASVTRHLEALTVLIPVDVRKAADAKPDDAAAAPAVDAAAAAAGAGAAAGADAAAEEVPGVVEAKEEPAAPKRAPAVAVTTASHIRSIRFNVAGHGAPNKDAEIGAEDLLMGHAGAWQVAAAGGITWVVSVPQSQSNDLVRNQGWRVSRVDTNSSVSRQSLDGPTLVWNPAADVLAAEGATCSPAEMLQWVLAALATVHATADQSADIAKLRELAGTSQSGGSGSVSADRAVTLKRFKGFTMGWGLSSPDAIDFILPEDCYLLGTSVVASNAAISGKEGILVGQPSAWEASKVLIEHKWALPAIAAPDKNTEDTFFPEPLKLTAGTQYTWVSWCNGGSGWYGTAVNGTSKDGGYEVSEGDVSVRYMPTRFSPNNGTSTTGGRCGALILVPTRLALATRAGASLAPHFVDPVQLSRADLCGVSSTASLTALVAQLGWVVPQLQRTQDLQTTTLATVMLRLLSQAMAPDSHGHTPLVKHLPTDAMLAGTLLADIHAHLAAIVNLFDTPLASLLPPAILESATACYTAGASVLYPSNSLLNLAITHLWNGIQQAGPVSAGASAGASAAATSAASAQYTLFGILAGVLAEPRAVATGQGTEQGAAAASGNKTDSKDGEEKPAEDKPAEVVVHTTPTLETADCLEAMLLGHWGVAAVMTKGAGLNEVVDMWEQTLKLVQQALAHDLERASRLLVVLKGLSLAVAGLYSTHALSVTGASADAGTGAVSTAGLRETCFNRKTSSQSSWGVNDGSVDEVCFTLTSAPDTVTLTGVYQYVPIGGNGDFSGVISVLDNDKTVLSSGTFNLSSAASEGTDLEHAAVVALDSPVELTPDSRYFLRLAGKASCSIYYGNHSTSSTIDDVKIDWSSSDSSPNGTCDSSGQFPGLQLRIGKAQKVVTADNTAVAGGARTEAAANLLARLCDNLASAADAVQAIPGACNELLAANISSVLLPSLTGVASAALCGSHAVALTAFTNLALKISEIQRNTASSAAPSDEDLVEQVSYHLETAHPYPAMSTHSWVADFPATVQWMLVYFDAKCSTVTRNDRVWLYSDVERTKLLGSWGGIHTDSKDLDRQEKANVGVWPTTPLIIPGHRLVVVFNACEREVGAKADFCYGVNMNVVGQAPSFQYGGPMRRLQLQAVDFLAGCAVTTLTNTSVAAAPSAAAAVGGSRALPATFDPEKKGGITYSDDMTTVTSSGSNIIVPLPYPISAGRIVATYTLVEDTTSQCSCFGAVTSDALTGDGGYSGADRWFLRAFNGNLYEKGREQTGGKKVQKGEVVIVTLDMDAGTISWNVAGEDVGTSFSGLTGSVYPAVEFYSSGRTIRVDSVEAFGAAASLYGGPSVAPAAAGPAVLSSTDINVPPEVMEALNHPALAAGLNMIGPDDTPDPVQTFLNDFVDGTDGAAQPLREWLLTMYDASVARVKALDERAAAKAKAEAEAAEAAAKAKADAEAAEAAAKAAADGEATPAAAPTAEGDAAAAAPAAATTTEAVAGEATPAAAAAETAAPAAAEAAPAETKAAEEPAPPAAVPLARQTSRAEAIAGVFEAGDSGSVVDSDSDFPSLTGFFDDGGLDGAWTGAAAGARPDAAATGAGAGGASLFLTKPLSDEAPQLLAALRAAFAAVVWHGGVGDEVVAAARYLRSHPVVRRKNADPTLPVLTGAPRVLRHLFVLWCAVVKQVEADARKQLAAAQAAAAPVAPEEGKAPEPAKPVENLELEAKFRLLLDANPVTAVAVRSTGATARLTQMLVEDDGSVVDARGGEAEAKADTPALPPAPAAAPMLMRAHSAMVPSTPLFPMRRSRSVSEDRTHVAADRYAQNLLQTPSVRLLQLLTVQRTQAAFSGPLMDVLTFANSEVQAAQLRRGLNAGANLTERIINALDAISHLLASLHDASALHVLLWRIVPILAAKEDGSSPLAATLEYALSAGRSHQLAVRLNHSFHMMLETIAYHVVNPCFGSGHVADPLSRDSPAVLSVASNLSTAQQHVQLSALRCWLLPVRKEDHAFLLASSVFGNLRALLGKAAVSTPHPVARRNVESNDITPKVTFKSGDKDVAALTDLSGTTYVEIDSKGFISLEPAAGTKAALVSVLLDTGDNFTTTNSVSLAFAENMQATFGPAAVTGRVARGARVWLPLLIPAAHVGFKAARLTVAGPARIRSIRVEELINSPLGEVVLDKQVQDLGMDVLRHLSGAVFKPTAEAEGNDQAELRERIAGVVSSSGLGGVQSRMLSMVLSEMQTAAQRLTADAISHKMDKDWRPEDDRYPFELACVFVSLAGSPEGARSMADGPALPTLLTVFPVSAPRVQRQVLQVLTRCLLYANLVELDKALSSKVPDSLMHHPLASRLARLVASSHGVEDDSAHRNIVRVSSEHSAGSTVLYLLLLLGLGIQAQVRARLSGRPLNISASTPGSVLRGCLGKEVWTDLHALLRKWFSAGRAAAAPASEETAKIDKDALPRALVTTVRLILAALPHELSGKLEAPAVATQEPFLWAALGALSLLDGETVAADFLFGDSMGAATITYCGNHDDGRTEARWNCPDCGSAEEPMPLCDQCDAVLHLPRARREHRREAIEAALMDVLVVAGGNGNVVARNSWITLSVYPGKCIGQLELKREGVDASGPDRDVCRFCCSPLSAENRCPSPASPALANICNEEDCMELAKLCCTKTLPCGHPCGGVRDEAECLPCLYGCSGTDIAHDALCMVCYTDQMSQGPAIQLGCGHAFHVQCVNRLLEGRWVGPRISFDFMRCPLCQAGMKHPALTPLLEPLETLRRTLRNKAVTRLRYESKDKVTEITSPDSKWYQDPEGYAENLYAYYLCSICKQPYFGGERACGPGGGGDFNPAELICGSCNPAAKAASCPKHGTDYVEFKCRYCCSIAVWFCHGTTHYCEPCHNSGGASCSAPHHQHGVACETCPIGGDHPAHGTEYAMGCAVCRNVATF